VNTEPFGKEKEEYVTLIDFCGSEVHETGSGSCPRAGFELVAFEPPGSVTVMLVKSELRYSRFCHKTALTLECIMTTH
jgi:hypothetical protein